jgi:hypothetical protein
VGRASLCLELRSGGEVWLKLCKGHAQYAFRVIEEKASQGQAADGS